MAEQMVYIYTSTQAAQKAARTMAKLGYNSDVVGSAVICEPEAYQTLSDQTIAQCAIIKSVML
jgi:hypothetical protein